MIVTGVGIPIPRNVSEMNTLTFDRRVTLLSKNLVLLNLLLHNIKEFLQVAKTFIYAYAIL